VATWAWKLPGLMLTRSIDLWLISSGL